MARMATTRRVMISTAAAWLLGFLIFFPILWMGLTSFKTELEAFAIPAVMPGSERYIARSLLGYDFFRRGLLADAITGGTRMRLFLVPEDSADAAASARSRARSSRPSTSTWAPDPTPKVQ